MSIKREATCDACGEAIVYRPPYPRNDFLVLSVAQAPEPEAQYEEFGIVYAIHQQPMLPRDMHFHNKACLMQWLEKSK